MSTQPTVMLTMGNDKMTSWLAFDERGEIIETVELGPDGKPAWDDGGIADHRGAGGADGFRDLHLALSLAEDQAKVTGFEIVRVPPPA